MRGIHRDQGNGGIQTGDGRSFLTRKMVSVVFGIEEKSTIPVMISGFVVSSAYAR
jgi:hypothetical protein